MNANDLDGEQRIALVNLTKAVFTSNQPFKLDGFVVKDTETDRKFVVNLEIKEIADMSAGLTGKSKLS